MPPTADSDSPTSSTSPDSEDTLDLQLPDEFLALIEE